MAEYGTEGSIEGFFHRAGQERHLRGFFSVGNKLSTTAATKRTEERHGWSDVTAQKPQAELITASLYDMWSLETRFVDVCLVIIALPLKAWHNGTVQFSVQRWDHVENCTCMYTRLYHENGGHCLVTFYSLEYAKHNNLLKFTTFWTKAMLSRWAQVWPSTA